MSKVLIFYSNPSETARLSLDKEHRIVDEAKARYGNESDILVRRHATTVEDLARELSHSNYDIIQFSGHGSRNGISLEGPNFQEAIDIPPEQLASMLRETQPQLKAAIFMCCYSADAISKLIIAAPYLVTVSGLASDDRAIDFVRVFYETYFQHRSIERAFYMAQLLSTQGDTLNTVLSRRTEHKQSSVLHQVFPFGAMGRGDSIIIDLSEAETDIDKLSISRDRFLSTLSRKIRVHKWIFDNPRESAIISIGHYFGVFSWANANDVVTCHKILEVKEDVSEIDCEAWANLTVAYNEKCNYRYRWSQTPSDLNNARMFKVVLDEYYKLADTYFEREPYVSVFRSLLPQQFRTLRSLIKANLTQADNKLAHEDYSGLIVYLETILSTIHDFIDALTEELTE